MDTWIKKIFYECTYNGELFRNVKNYIIFHEGDRTGKHDVK